MTISASFDALTGAFVYCRGVFFGMIQGFNGSGYCWLVSFLQGRCS